MERFFLKIDASTTDENQIDSSTEAHIECTGVIAVNVLVRFFENEPELRGLFYASLEVLKKKELADKISMN
jgi:hypothetical protein